MLDGRFRLGLLRPGARFLRGCGLAAVVAAVAGVAAMAASPPKSGQAAGEIPWFIYEAPPNPNAGRAPQAGPAPIAQCAAESARLSCAGNANERNCLAIHYTSLSSACQAAIAAPSENAARNDRSGVPTCIRSVVCGPTNGQGISWSTNPGGVRGGNGGWTRVRWKSTPDNMGYSQSYPYALPEGAGGAVSIGIDSKDNLWVFQRSPVGVPSLTKFGPDRKMLFTLSDDVIGHQNKAHGMNVDPDGNAWIADPSSATVMVISPEGKVVRTIGTKNKRGDWDEAKGQRLLWQPISIAFGKDGDAYIGQGHANESPNDTQSGDPANVSGAARVTHVDKNGKFINQWYGNMTGAGKFSMVHDIAVDPRDGNVWIGDREQYRFVIYTPEGEFVRTLQMRNLTCNIAFDPKTGDAWMGTGGDGQLVRFDRETGKVLGAMGAGEVGETGYIRWDSKGVMYMGSTGQNRVTVWTPPARR